MNVRWKRRGRGARATLPVIWQRLSAMRTSIGAAVGAVARENKVLRTAPVLLKQAERCELAGNIIACEKILGIVKTCVDTWLHDVQQEAW